MVSSRSSNTKYKNSLSSSLSGSCFSIISMVGCAVVFSGLLLLEKCKEDNLKYFAFPSLLISSFIGAVCAERGNHQDKKICVLCGGINMCIAILISAFVYRATRESLIQTSIIVLSGSILAGLLYNPKKKIMPHKKK